MLYFFLLKFLRRIRDVNCNVTKITVLFPVSCSAPDRIGKQKLVYNYNIFITLAGSESTSSVNDVNLILFSTVT